MLIISVFGWPLISGIGIGMAIAYHSRNIVKLNTGRYKQEHPMIVEWGHSYEESYTINMVRQVWSKYKTVSSKRNVNVCLAIVDLIF